MRHYQDLNSSQTLAEVIDKKPTSYRIKYPKQIKSVHNGNTKSHTHILKKKIKKKVPNAEINLMDALSWHYLCYT